MLNPPAEHIDEKTAVTVLRKDEAQASDNKRFGETERDSADIVIVTGADVAAHLLPMRDDFDPTLTFRAAILGSGLAAFLAVMTQIYTFKPTQVDISKVFLVLASYFVGNAWAKLLPRGDKFEVRWRRRDGQGKLPWWITVIKFINPGPFGLKEHSISVITATAAGYVTNATSVFAAQKLFYDLPLSATTVILGIISIGLFGCGLCGFMRSFAVWDVEAVYWGELPVVKTLQGLHWDQVENSKPLKYFWYAFTGMSLYEIFPAYIFPWLNSVSIPCLASQKATGNKGAILTNLFGGATANEGLGLFSLSFDWQYITSSSTAIPLKLILHTFVGTGICAIVMIGIYFGNGWGARSMPFMATNLLTANGTRYPVKEVFPGGLLDKSVIEKHGLSQLTGSFAFGLFMANAAIGALILHCILFWGEGIWSVYQRAREGKHDDPHHTHMAKHYKDTPWWCFAGILIVSFVLGLVVVIKENITLPVWAYIVSLALGMFISPFSVVLFARFGNGIATNNLSKMLAGLMLPGRPVGNMYFAAWSHNVVLSAGSVSTDLKLGEYLKIPPRIMLWTQIYGIILGGFINYAILSSIISANRDLLAEGNGNSSWSGATMQGFNTKAASWALSPYLYKFGAKYELIPIALAVGAAAVTLHRVFYQFVPKIGRFDISEINLPQFIQYAGNIPNQPQTCTILSGLLCGLFTQAYLRNYHPRIFKDYSYIIAGAFDAGSLLIVFILSFAVNGAGGPSHPFPSWWGNNQKGNVDWCPVSK
ncbi:Oligopeptide transporter OPT superfamily [Penicillium expansum]|nr:Oligopeptide transporter OPT superfamily [Penicillium expansum]